METNKIAIILSIIPGLGHIYLGIQIRAVILFIVDFIAAYLLVFTQIINSLSQPDFTETQWVLILVIFAAIWIVSILDTSRIVEKQSHNQ